MGKKKHPSLPNNKELPSNYLVSRAQIKLDEKEMNFDLVKKGSVRKEKKRAANAAKWVEY